MFALEKGLNQEESNAGDKVFIWDTDLYGRATFDDQTFAPLTFP